jgi:carboxyl-terminal processing protease
MDPGRLMPVFNRTMRNLIESGAPGLVIDLRGNPGGLGAMVAGMAGWFLSEEDACLGTLRLRSGELKLVAYSRPQLYRGPIAVLLDSMSLCGSEVLATALREHGLARVFGERTAGMAQVGNLLELPNGDLFMYVLADYQSVQGVRLEGHGVEPDVVIHPTRTMLLEGRDPVLSAALDWLTTLTDETPKERKRP